MKVNYYLDSDKPTHIMDSPHAFVPRVGDYISYKEFRYRVEIVKINLDKCCIDLGAVKVGFEF